MPASAGRSALLQNGIGYDLKLSLEVNKIKIVAQICCSHLNSVAGCALGDCQGAECDQHNHRRRLHFWSNNQFPGNLSCLYNSCKATSIRHTSRVDFCRLYPIASTDCPKCSGHDCIYKHPQQIIISSTWAGGDWADITHTCQSHFAVTCTQSQKPVLGTSSTS